MQEQSMINIPVLQPGQTYSELGIIQDILNQRGYFIDEYERERLDTPTQIALRRFQAFYKLPDTEPINAQTIEKLAAPKCGNPDLRGHKYNFKNKDNILADPLEDYAPDLIVKAGCDYRGESTLTYWINDAALPQYITSASMVMEMRRAFDAWQQHILVNFERVSNKDDAKFWIEALVGNHGDDQKFDGKGGTLAHAYYPKDCGHSYSGHCHFDNAETWNTFENQAFNIKDICTIAVHEIGHLLGLTHSTDENSIMYPLYRFSSGMIWRQLSSDVIPIIQSIYGIRP